MYDTCIHSLEVMDQLISIFYYLYSPTKVYLCSQVVTKVVELLLKNDKNKFA